MPTTRSHQQDHDLRLEHHSRPNCSATTSGEWLGSMIPPAPSRSLLVSAVSRDKDSRTGGLEAETPGPGVVLVHPVAGEAAPVGEPCEFDAAGQRLHSGPAGAGHGGVQHGQGGGGGAVAGAADWVGHARAVLRFPGVRRAGRWGAGHRPTAAVGPEVFDGGLIVLDSAHAAEAANILDAGRTRDRRPDRTQQNPSPSQPGLRNPRRAAGTGTSTALRPNPSGTSVRRPHEATGVLARPGARRTERPRRGYWRATGVKPMLHASETRRDTREEGRSFISFVTISTENRSSASSIALVSSGASRW
ncbi:hypothetical protein QFZ58_000202 [Streptomyces sp. B1I3]|nr:hypothetical protein [Streptomyces sp. B1I3]